MTPPPWRLPGSPVQRLGLLLLALLAVMLLGGRWPAGAAAPASFEKAPLAIDTGQQTHHLEVELARSPAQRQFGLMERDRLGERAGMLFLYDRPQPPRSGFWMYRTRIPLDIAFIDAGGRIAAIHTMQPCGSDDPGDCPVTLAGVTYVAALEVNAGFFATNGIGLGDCVTWPGRPPGCRPAD
ncbi:DUF192 domain-containing protein [Halomonas campisalis]|uniref:DUF192 domain-containing protein n=1 Tax=Billgrantia campisalis TaxID=74661 RepID=A0ABS9PAS3_9GAMM|nr:DUF192 domain-containing protein [Halomonas campisalis]MCG6658230.1 DUF192 domain-containing protein [Halomonas campisalis]MDR5862898.1 DUF192 domain-containing protein [Halomonas campisalis]